MILLATSLQPLTDRCKLAYLSKKLSKPGLDHRHGIIERIEAENRTVFMHRLELIDKAGYPLQSGSQLALQFMQFMLQR